MDDGHESYNEITERDNNEVGYIFTLTLGLFSVLLQGLICSYTAVTVKFMGSLLNKQ